MGHCPAIFKLIIMIATNYTTAEGKSKKTLGLKVFVLQDLQSTTSTPSELISVVFIKFSRFFELFVKNIGT
jgi:hypothetical protein